MLCDAWMVSCARCHRAFVHMLGTRAAASTIAGLAVVCEAPVTAVLVCA